MGNARAILVIDDDQDFRAGLAEELEFSGHFVLSEAGSAREAENKLITNRERYDALILDAGLPDGDGRDLCATLRRLSIKVPIIIVSGSAAEADVVRGLNAGANDYVAKPIRLAELIARLRTQIRIFEDSEDAVFTIGPYLFRPAAKVLQDKLLKRKIPLTGKEAAILKYLYRVGQKPVTRQDLLNEVWGFNATATTHTLETHIYRLRQKIEVDPGQPTLLITIGGGYRLEAVNSQLAA